MYDVQQQELVVELSNELKGKIEMPDWANFVKTGMHKERPPVQNDWWYLRAASVLRQVHLKGPIGVSKLRYKYGGRKTSRGMKPEHFYKGSGKIIRTILQQLEEAKLIKQGQKGVHKGRVLTKQGNSLMFNTASKLGKPPAKPKAEKEKKPAKTTEEKKTEKKTEKKSEEKKPAEKKTKVTKAKKSSSKKAKGDSDKSKSAGKDKEGS